MRTLRDQMTVAAHGDDAGIAGQLVGRSVPRLSFVSTHGARADLADLARTHLVLYIYPRINRLGQSPPPGWDEVVGARGCTPQTCAFRDRHARFDTLGFTVAGLSAQSPQDQAEAAQRLGLPFQLLADPRLRLATALALPTFETAGTTFYKRLTLVAQSGVVIKVFYPVVAPQENAADVAEWLTTRSGTPGGTTVSAKDTVARSTHGSNAALPRSRR